VTTPHQTELQVRFYELDMYGHVNHAIYVHYFETARIELLDSIGFGLDRLAEDDTQLVVIALSTRFLRAAVLGDRLTIETAQVETGRVRSTWAQRILRGDETFVTQYVQFATTDSRGKPRRTPADLGEALAQFQAEEDWLGADGPRAL